MPLAEVITDFFDQLKSRTKGYASMSFQDIGFREGKLVRLDIKINGELFEVFGNFFGIYHVFLYKNRSLKKVANPF